MACMGCRTGMGRIPGFYRGRRIAMGEDVTDPVADLVTAVAASEPADNADTMIETGQIMYKEGYSSGQVKGLLIGALIGAGLLLLVR